MRKLIYALNVTLDGCCDHTRMMPDAEVHEYFTQLTRDAGLLVYGRKTYQLMVPFWPDVAKSHSMAPSMNDFADAFVSTNKVVFSRSLEISEANTKVVRAHLQEEILRLKQEQGNDLLVGGVDLASQLIESGLVDEYRFVVHPIVAVEGTRLFNDMRLPEKLQLRLVESKTFESGCVALHYEKQ
jgi:dihydrofolate reductase